MSLETLQLEPTPFVTGSVTIPGSKSLSNRALLLAALATGTTRVDNLLDSEDVQSMLRALRTLGVVIKQISPTSYSVVGQGGLFKVSGSYRLNLENAGTVFRPLLAILAFNQGEAEFIIEGQARLYERPIADLVNCLRAIGAEIDYLDKEDYAPLRVRTHAQPRVQQAGNLEVELAREQETLSPQELHLGLFTATETEPYVLPSQREVIELKLAGNLSSQFLTAVLMLSPLLGSLVHIELTTELVSKPYIDLTIDYMRRFGVQVDVIGDYQAFYIAPQQYISPQQILVEGDASSASYFLLTGAVAGSVTVHGVTQESIQGDIRFAQVLEQMGAQIEYGSDYIRASVNQELQNQSGYPLKPLDRDFNDIPDAAMGIAIAALFTPPQRKTIIRNVYNWRLKETDRLHAMATELQKLGVQVYEGTDYLEVVSPLSLSSASIATYNDHRMAMCFALASLHPSQPRITIQDPQCTQKTFPTFFALFNDLRKAS